MATHLRVDGSWPGPVVMSAGWARARARPWNETVTDPMVRLERGSADFLRSVSRRLIELGATTIYSPALYRGTTGVWNRSGFEPYAELVLMERSLRGVGRNTHEAVSQADDPDWEAVLRLDRTAFQGFWRMSRLGLGEAYQSSSVTALLQTMAGEEMTGYAIVGSQWGVAYLHRIAVHPSFTSRGLGRALLETALSWGRARGARSMVLNVREDNDRAQHLYERCGFAHTGSRLMVLCRNHVGRNPG